MHSGWNEVKMKHTHPDTLSLPHICCLKWSDMDEEKVDLGRLSVWGKICCNLSPECGEWSQGEVFLLVEESDVSAGVAASQPCGRWQRGELVKALIFSPHMRVSLEGSLSVLKRAAQLNTSCRRHRDVVNQRPTPRADSAAASFLSHMQNFISPH